MLLTNLHIGGFLVLPKPNCIFGGSLPHIHGSGIRNLHAVALAEPSAAFVPFQRI